MSIPTYLTRSQYGLANNLSPKQINNKIKDLREPSVRLYNGRILIKEDFPSIFFSGEPARPEGEQDKRKWDRIYRNTITTITKQMHNENGY
jgi:hypothetical protein